MPAVPIFASSFLKEKRQGRKDPMSLVARRLLNFIFTFKKFNIVLAFQASLFNL